MWIAQMLNMVTYASILVIACSGLSVLFGVMGVINFAHGALYVLGGYLGLTVGVMSGSFTLAIAASIVVMALVGLVMHVGFFSSARMNPTSLLLVTYGVSLIIEDLVRNIWGPKPQTISIPELLGGTVSIGLGGLNYPVYRLFLIAIGAVVVMGLYMVFYKTKLGTFIRAATEDREMTLAMGINVIQIAMIVLAGGVALAGVSGYVAGPILGLTPSMGGQILIQSFIILIIGGVGSVAGMALGAVLVSLIQTLGAVLAPGFSSFLLCGAVILVVLLLPGGLVGMFSRQQ